MATQFIDKKSTTAEVLNRPNAAGIATVEGGLVVNDGSAPANVDQGTIVSVAVDTSLTKALHAGRTVKTGAAALDLHLPNATGSGDRYRIVIGTAANDNKIDCAAGADFFVGTILIGDGGDSTAALVDSYTADGTTHDFINPTTAGGGGKVGDWLEFEDIAAGIWKVFGSFQNATDPTTPFATS